MLTSKKKKRILYNKNLQFVHFSIHLMRSCNIPSELADPYKRDQLQLASSGQDELLPVSKYV